MTENVSKIRQQPSVTSFCIFDCHFANPEYRPLSIIILEILAVKITAICFYRYPGHLNVLLYGQKSFKESKTVFSITLWMRNF